MWAWGKAKKTRRSGDSAEEIDGYRDLVQVGQGGFGVVYRAWQEHLDREVAVKVLAVPAVDEAALTRFERECQLTSRLTGHPNVVTVLDTGTARSGRPYVATEYFEHGSLKQHLDRDGPLPLKEALRVGVKVAGALAAAHDAGILHRDIKPENILVSGYGEPALADFGVARLLDTSDLSTRTDALTIHHIAPEILEDTPPSQASDVYALGSTLYQLLSGYPPHRRSSEASIASVLRRILSEDPPDIARPDVPEQVMAIVRKAMARHQQNRFADPLALAVALQHLQAEYGFAVTELSLTRGQTQSSTQAGTAASLPPLSRSPQSHNTVKRPQSAGAEGPTPRPDSDISSTILRPSHTLHDKTPSKHRWRLALTSLLTIVATVGGGGLVAWSMSADPKPPMSARTDSRPTTAPSPPTNTSVSPSLSPAPPELAPSSPQRSSAPSRPRLRGEPPATQSTFASPPAPAAQSAPPAQPGQQPPIVISGYHIKNSNSGMCLAPRLDSGEYLVRQVHCDQNDTTQRWERYFPDPLYDVFQIRNATSLKCIATRGTVGSPAVVTACDSDSWFDLWEPPAVGVPGFGNVGTHLCLVGGGDQVGYQAYLTKCSYSQDQFWGRY
jgi:serine/threonine protein kinase